MSKQWKSQTSVAPSEIWLRDDLENIYALLFRFLGYGFWLAMSNMGWLVTQKFVILVPNPIVFAPWSVMYGCTGSFVTVIMHQDTLFQLRIA